jgi:hypothetical protein
MKNLIAYSKPMLFLRAILTQRVALTYKWEKKNYYCIRELTKKV